MEKKERSKIKEVEATGHSLWTENKEVSCMGEGTS
jgi:hypothetical protein